MRIAVLFLDGATGTPLNAHFPDPLAKADAIVVLGGENDGREAYGLKLAQRRNARPGTR